MRLEQDTHFTTLSWVKPELDESLKQARLALQDYVEEGGDRAQLQACAGHLHQVQGALRMVEIYGAAMVAEEMEQLATALLGDAVGDRDEAYTALMRSIMQLPDYLERLQSGHKDVPMALLPLINDLRGARGEKVVPESVLLGLGAGQLDESELAHARGSLAGHNRELLGTVAAGIKEDLLRVKDALDLHLRASGAAATDLAPQADALSSVADTLGMLGLGVPRRIVQDQRTAIQQLASGQRAVDEAALLEIAGSLLQVEATLDDQVARLGQQEDAGQPAAAGTVVPLRESQEALDALIKESVSNFVQARQCFVAFIEAGWDHAQLNDVPRLLDEVSGAMHLLEQPRAARQLRALSVFTQFELVKLQRVPDASQMDRLADALASLEYYLEALRDHRPQRDRILDLAEHGLVALGYWPIPASAEQTLMEAAKPVPTVAVPAAAPAAAPAPVTPAVVAVSVEPAPTPPPAPVVVAAAPVAAAAPEPAVAAPVVPAPAATPAPAASAAPPVTTPAPAAAPAAAGKNYGFADSAEIDDDIREVFIEELDEELNNLADLYAQWQAAPNDLEVLRPLRRVFHTLKGSGRLVGALELGEFSWKFEGMLNRVLDGSRPASEAVLAHVGLAKDVLPQFRGALMGEATVTADIEGLKETADRIAAGEDVVYTPSAAGPSAEQLEAERVAAAAAAAERLAAEQAEAARVAAEHAEAERVAAEHAQAQRLAAEQAEAERLAAEQAEAERVAAEQAEAERVAAEHAEAERLAAEQAAAERVAAEQAEAERVAAEHAEAERLAAEQAEAERVAAEHAEAQRLAAEQAEAERVAVERAEAERRAAEHAEAERVAAEHSEAERLAAEQAEAERVAAEHAEAERLAAEQVEAERAAAERVEAERRLLEESERLAAQRKAAEQAEIDLLAAAMAEELRAARTEHAVAVAAVDVVDVEPAAVEESAHTSHAAETASEPALPDGAAYATVDPTLLEILRTEVDAHLQTIQHWLASSADVAQPVSDALLRAVHTISGAFAMTEVPLITEALSPTEGYMRRMLVHRQIPTAAGVELLRDIAQAIQEVLAALQQPHPVVLSQEALAQRAIALRDALPEPTAPTMPLALDEAEEAQEAERLAAEQAEADRVTSETAQAEPVEAEHADSLEAERAAGEPTQAVSEVDAAAEQAEAERLEYARLEAEYAEQARLAEQQRRAAEQAEEERLEYERLEAEYAEQSRRAEEERLAAEHAEAQRLAAEQAEAEQAAAEQAEAERAEAERAEAERAEAERAEAERAEAERAAAEQAEAEQAAAEQAEAERAAAEHAEAERAAAEHAEAERAEAERAEAERAAAEQAEAERAEAERLAAEHAEAERAEAERLAAERAEAERIEAEQAHTEQEQAPAEGSPEPEHTEGAPTPALGYVFSSSVDRDPDSPLDMADVDPDLLDIFVEETTDILDHSDGLLSRLRESPTERESVVGLQRDLHTLKGGARMCGMMSMGELAHAMESVLEGAADARLELGSQGLGILEQGFDRLHGMLSRITSRQAVALPEHMIAVFNGLARGVLPVVVAAPPETLVAGESATAEVSPVEHVPQGDVATPALENVAPEAVADAGPADTGADIRKPGLRPLSTPVETTALDEGDDTTVRAPQEQVRIRADLLDRLVNYAGEVAIYRARLEQQLGTFRTHLDEMEQTTARLRQQLRKLEIETEAQISARYQRAGEVEKEFDPLELDRFSTQQQLTRALSESASDMSSLHASLDEVTRQYETLLLQQSRVSSELQDGLMRTRMVPFDALVPRLRRVIRQAAAETSKQIQLKVDGAQGEMDRNVLDRMTAPLEHMLRNSAVHGLETPAERAEAGKPEEGTVTVSMRREGSEVVMHVSDDGRGLNREAIRRKAVERGLLKPDAHVTDNALFAFILESGFSTADTVSRLAGRGVGMDVVHNEIRQLGGSLQLDSVAGKGTTVTIRLPFTLAVTQAAIVKIGETSFAVPISSVQGVGRIARDELEKQLGSSEPTFTYAGEPYAIHDLGRLLGQAPAKAPTSLQMPLLLSRSGDTRAAICVDEVLGSREIVVKPVGPQVSSIPGIFGATIMGDGGVMVILDVVPLVRRAAAALAAAPDEPVAEAAPEVRRIPLVMVVDDSITMRKVTGRVLERNNLEVLAAKDGVDAIEKMAEVVPDVMLLDIEMPRMDGYELATHMRNDPRLRDVPIIMITSRSGDKHRQRAFEIGVNRYLGKPYQEAELMRNVFELLTPVHQNG